MSDLLSCLEHAPAHTEQINRLPILYLFPVYSADDIHHALTCTQRDVLPVKQPVLEIRHTLDLLPKLDFDNLDNDPIFQASLNLSLPLLFSLAQLPDAKDWTALVLSRHPQLDEPKKVQYLIQSAESWKIATQAGQTGQNTRERNRFIQMYEHQRHIFAFLCADALCKQQGFDIQKDFLQPASQLQLELGYEPYMPDLKSRAAGTQIYLYIREVLGKLYLAREALAYDNMLRPLVKNFQLIVVHYTYYMQTIQQELEKDMAIKLSLTKNGLELTNGNWDTQTAQRFIKENPIMKTMLAIARADYGHSLVQQEMLDILGPEPTPHAFNNFAQSLTTLMLDPMLAQVIKFYPSIMDVETEALQVPKFTLQELYQIHAVQEAWKKRHKQRA